MLSILLVITGSIFLVELVLLFRSLLSMRRERRRKRKPYTPKVVVVAPHFGWDARTERNARRLLDLDYPGEYRILFVTHRVGPEGHDISWSHLKKLAAPSGRASVLLAPNVVDSDAGRSQKAQNMLTALAAVPADAEVFAFIDADAGIERDWLTRLVEPLQDEEVGVTTGARFYAPLLPGLAALTEAVWVNFQIPLYGERRLGMVWGGSSAIRRSLFEEGRIGKRWERATFEDQHITRAMNELNRKIHFVPDCIPVNFIGERSWREVLEFTNRQMVVTYWMKLFLSWRLSLALFLPKGVVFLVSLPLVLFDPSRWYPLLIVPVLETLSYLVFTRSLPASVRNERTIRKTMYIAAVAAPWAMLVCGINALFAVFQKSIVWGGVRYSHRSSGGCEVLGRAPVRPPRKRENRITRWSRSARLRLARFLGVEPGFGLDELSEEEE